MQPIKALSAEQVTDCGREYGRKLQHACPVIWAPAAPGGGLPHGQRERGGGGYHCQGPGHLLSSLAKFQVLL